MVLYKEIKMLHRKILSEFGMFLKWGNKNGCSPFSTSFVFLDKTSCKVAIIGGGAGGVTMAARLNAKIGSKNLIIIEPSDVHYYQPYWTLVGGGIKELKDTYQPTSTILPKHVKWVKDRVTFIDPVKHTLETKGGTKIEYDFLIIAIGLNLAFEKIKGLPDAFETPGVCSNYSFQTVSKTLSSMKSFRKGNAIFTQPPNPIKCAGAPQKIMYLAEDYFRKNGKREDANVLFYTALGTIFSAPKYAKALSEVAKKKGITVNYNHNLVEVKPESKEAVFQKLGESNNLNKTQIVKYEMIHITPPMVAPALLKQSSLAEPSGFLDLDKHTLQHKKYPNVFGIGDCTSLPTSKTAAAVAAQSGILTTNMLAVMDGKEPLAKYNGYTSCPLVTGNKKGILAEFDYDLQPIETFPFDQSKERYVQYIIKKDAIPFIYWNAMLKGYWDGPGVWRKILHLGMTR